MSLRKNLFYLPDKSIKGRINTSFILYIEAAFNFVEFIRVLGYEL